MPSRHFSALLLALLAACAAEPRSDAPSPAPAEVHEPAAPPGPIDGHPEVPDSLRVRVDLFPVPTSPMALMISVGALDAAALEASAPTEPIAGVCVVGLAAYRDTADDVAPAWRLRGETLACSPSPTLPISAIDRRIPVTEILGDSLSPGPYRFAALVSVRGDTFAAPAGRIYLSPDTLPPVRDRSALRYRVETRVEETAPRELVTRVAVTNAGSRRVEVQFGACSLVLRAYRNPARTGKPAFRSERRAPPFHRGKEGFGFGYACPLYLAGTVIAPGETISPKEFTARIPFAEIMGDSLPDGRYHFAAELEWLADRPTAGLDHDTVRLVAGEAELTSRIDPLPPERTVGGIRYRARTEPVAGRPGTLRLSVTATNTGAREAHGRGEPVRRPVRHAAQRLRHPRAARRVVPVRRGRLVDARVPCAHPADAAGARRVAHLLRRFHRPVPAPLPHPRPLDGAPRHGDRPRRPLRRRDGVSRGGDRYA